MNAQSPSLRVGSFGLLAFLCLSACGDDPSPVDPNPMSDAGTGTSTATFSAQMVAQELADAYCSYEARCRPQWLSVDIRPDSCRAFAEGDIRNAYFPGIAAAVDGGRIEFNAAALTQCVAKFKTTATCNDALGPYSFSWEHLCPEAFVGKVVTGQGCSVDEECAASDYCAFAPATPGAPNACMGTCQARAVANAQCDRDRQCAAGLQCNNAGVCEPYRNRDEACVIPEDCAMPFACVSVAGQSAKVCRSFRDIMTVAQGQVCSIDIEEPTSFCQEGLSCSGPSSGLNNPPARCIQPLAPGAECSFGLPDPCPSGQACIPRSDVEAEQGRGLCRAPLAAGEACFGFDIDPCAPGLGCINDVCTAYKNNGEPCTIEDECFSGICTAANVCAAPEPDGCF